MRGSTRLCTAAADDRLNELLGRQESCPQKLAIFAMKIELLRVCAAQYDPSGAGRPSGRSTKPFPAAKEDANTSYSRLNEVESKFKFIRYLEKIEGHSLREDSIDVTLSIR
jgi:hypothetical protein